MINKVRKTIDRYRLIGDDEHIVLGLSGGPDSVCLFHVLRELGYSVHAVHVNHMLRSAADRDEAFVKKMCRDLGAEFTAFRVDCQALAKDLKVSTEEAGRRARYDAFRRAADDLKSRGINVKIAVAHNADDQAETLMFRILRGTGTDGLAGMEHMRKDGEYEVVRPLLDVTRAEIEKYCEENGIDNVIDETNEKPIYARNRLRLELLPLIREQYNDNITAGLCRLAAVAGEDKDYMWQQAEAAYEQALVSSGGRKADRIVLDRSVLAKAHPAIRKRVIMKALRELGLWEDISYERLSAVDAQIGGVTSTKVIELPRGYSVTVAFDKIKIKDHGKSENSGKVLSISVESSMITKGEEVRTILRQISGSGYSKGVLILDAGALSEASGIPEEELAGNICTRTRHEGDFLPARAGTKKLKKLFGEMKIPADERDRTPLIAAGKCVLAVCPGNGENTRYADALSVNNETKVILTVKFV